MKGFFLLLTISLLIMLQIQRGMLQTIKPGMVTGTPAPTTTPRRTTTAAAGIATAPRTPARTNATPARTNATGTAGTTPTTNPSPSFAATKKQTGSAPALSSLGGVSILIILTNTFIQLFHLS